MAVVADLVVAELVVAELHAVARQAGADARLEVSARGGGDLAERRAAGRRPRRARRPGARRAAGAEFVLVAVLHAVAVIADLVGTELEVVAVRAELLDVGRVGRVAQEHDTRRRAARGAVVAVLLLAPMLGSW